jgi:BMFP domain-containing protein YqiC
MRFYQGQAHQPRLDPPCPARQYQTNDAAKRLSPQRTRPMTQTTSRFFEEMAKLMTDAAGAAQGFRQDAETLFRSQAEKVLRDLHVVQREEFEAVKAMAAKALEENERLAKRVGDLEAALAARDTGGGAKPV